MTQHTSGPATPLPGAPQPTGWIRFTLQGNALTGGLIMPTVRLNGRPVPVAYGENLYPVVPGRWRVDVESQWLRTYGQAALDLSVEAGRTVPVYYAQPHHQFATGSIGFEPQRRQGAGGAMLIVAIVLLCVLMLPLAGILLASLGVFG